MAWADDAEIDALCWPLVQNAAKCRFLRGLGLTVTEAHNGRPKVLATNLERVLGGLPKPGEQPPAEARQVVKPDRAQFKLVFGGKA